MSSCSSKKHISWTDERIEITKKLTISGLTAKEVSELTGFSFRSAQILFRNIMRMAILEGAITLMGAYIINRDKNYHYKELSVYSDEILILFK